MFTVYHANQVADQKDLLIKILEQDPNPNPFSQEIILVQSLGMAQWLQMQIAEGLGVAGNLQFPYPTSFLWQQYRLLFPELPKENIFERNSLVWRLMRLIPHFLEQAEFSSLQLYLKQVDQARLYQLASKIADLFDQYLVYRPQWLVAWEQGQQASVFQEISQSIHFKPQNSQYIQVNIAWQSILWNAVVEDIRQDSDEVVFNTSHRAYLQQRYFEKLAHLTPEEKAKLPPRIFIFGISSLPKTQLAVLDKLSEHCHIHLFFTNPSEQFWGDNREDRLLEKIALKQQLSSEELEELFEYQGNPLLATWGKQGREFLNLLTELAPQAVDFYENFAEAPPSLLNQVKQAILQSKPNSPFELLEGDDSIQLHSCHSKMREVEVLHNRLLQLFEQYPDLSPKDIIVMSADIDSYAPYINAVFTRYSRTDPRFIPFTLSDQKISYINPIIASFLQLLAMKESQFAVEEIVDLFNVQAIKQRYQFSDEQIHTLRQWIESAGIRAGIDIENPQWQNYNSWENGLNRLLLGTCLTEQNQQWQGIVAFDQSYGLNAELVGQLAKFLQNLTAWHRFMTSPHSLEQWHLQLTQLVADFYHEDEESIEAINLIYQAIEQIAEQIHRAKFTADIEVDIIQQLFEQQLSEQRSHLNFLVGKVNFCTLLPMRAIPFKVVCLLGMNEGEFPRQQSVNSFDLMQYAPQKGDRARRDDDRYLFLEALLSAEQIFYLSYIGQSLTSSALKLPSILVSQLWDYLEENIEDKTAFDSMLIKHSMTVFSPKNFTNGNVAYDKEWLEVKHAKKEVRPFLSPIESDTVTLPSQVELADLIAYIQSPLKFFFQRILGVHLEYKQQQLEKAEHFQLSHLENYQFYDQLLKIDQTDTANFFHTEQLKGNLPANNFAKLAELKLVEKITPLKQQLAGYLTQTPTILEIDQMLELKQGNVQLIGNLPHCFGDQLVLWRVGKLRDKDLIQCWIYSLVAQLHPQPVSQCRFYSRKDDGVSCVGFKPITPELAKELLQGYMQDYLASFSQLHWALSHNLVDYIKNANESSETSGTELCQNALDNQQDSYLQRILVQSDNIDFEAIHQRTLTWFATMVEYMEEYQ